MTWVRCVTLMLSTIFWLPQSSAAPVLPAQVAVYFSLHGGAMEAVVRELAVAKLQVLMQAYTFTSASIA